MIFLSRRGFLGLALALAGAAALPAWARRLGLLAAGLWQVPMTVPMEVAHGEVIPIATPAATVTNTPAPTATATAVPEFKQYFPMIAQGDDDN